MKCIIWHNDSTSPHILAKHMRCKKGLIAYYKSNGITSTKKYVDFNHYALLKIYIKRCKHCPRSVDHEPIKKKAHVFPYVLFNFFSTTSKFLKVGKGLLLLKTIASIWLQRLACRLCWWVVFPSMNVFVEVNLLSFVEKTMTTYV